MEFAKTKILNLTKSKINKTIDHALSTIEIPQNIKIDKFYEEDPDVLHDIFRIEEVFHNIILNSIQAIKDTGTIKVTVRKSTNSVKIIFEDTGEGITKEDLPKIFDPLFSRKAMGIGFGMTIVKDIIDKHGWEIYIESAPVKGTIVTIEIPHNN